MFFLVERTETLALAPKYFDKNVKDHIYNQLKLKVQGKCTGKFGYTILVTNLANVGRGRLHEDSGFAHFAVTYVSVVFRPFKNEILPATVTIINQNGFFAQAGPLEIFVSKTLMPEDLKFDPRDQGLPTYYSEEEDVRIEQGSPVRIKIVGIRLAADKISTIGTIKEDYLG
jgi:DNA-directed RNA polymerase II subunit RPB7